MAHEIETHDMHQGIAQAWHGLTQVMPDLSLGNCQFKDWEFVNSPMFDMDGQELPWQFLGSNDKPGIHFGKPFDPKTFSVFSNAELLSIFSDLEECGARLTSALTIQNRAKRVFTFSLGDEFTVAGRKSLGNLVAMDSIDGTGTCLGFGSITTVVCANTLRLALGNKGDVLFSVKHTKNGKAKLSKVPEFIAEYFKATAAYSAKLNNAEQIACNAEQARGFLSAWLMGGLRVKDEQLVADMPEGFLSRRSVNRVDAIVDLFKNGAGNHGENAADLFNGVTDYYSHASAGGDDRMKQYESSEFGSGATDKRAFYDVMPEDFLTLANIADMGNRVYDASLVELNA